jgi:hypothetical protein
MGTHGNAVVYNRLNMHCLCNEKDTCINKDNDDPLDSFRFMYINMGTAEAHS